MAGRKRRAMHSELETQILALAGIKVPKRSKYGNKSVTIDGVRFPSQHEARRWRILKLLEQAGQISELKRQVPFPLHAKDGTKICDYRSDFTYLDKSGRLIVEDAKGVRTDLYKLKKKWLKAEYGIEILET